MASATDWGRNNHASNRVQDTQFNLPRKALISKLPVARQNSAVQMYSVRNRIPRGPFTKKHFYNAETELLSFHTNPFATWTVGRAW